MERIVIFTGPTIGAREAKKHLDATYLPPVSRGEVYRAVKQSPFAIGIIDGFFDQTPAVWHKEILWAMRHGVHVFGSSSMGALRAAELAHYGMVGVGRIFADYHAGKLMDDDEVALAHGPRECEYMPVSVPMVNIRYTLANAVREGVTSEENGQQVIEIAKSLYYPRRTYKRVINHARRAKVNDQELNSLSEWLATGQVDQKHIDAIEMLSLIRRFVQTNKTPKQVSYAFENTDMWVALTDSLDN